MEALEARGRGLRNRALAGRAAAAREGLLRRRHEVGRQHGHDDLGAVSARSGGSHRPRSSARNVDEQPVALGAGDFVVAGAAAAIRRTRGARLRSRGVGSRAYGPASAPISSGGPAGPCRRRAGRSRRSAPWRSTSTVRPGSSCRTTSSVESSPEPWVALLPALDPTVMGWKERAWYLGEHGPALFDRSGNAGPTVWSNGRIVGGWAGRNGGGVAFRLLEDVGADAAAEVEAEAARLDAWLGGTNVIPRFGAPLERELRWLTALLPPPSLDACGEQHMSRCGAEAGGSFECWTRSE